MPAYSLGVLISMSTQAKAQIKELDFTLKSLDLYLEKTVEGGSPSILLFTILVGSDPDTLLKCYTVVLAETA